LDIVAFFVTGNLNDLPPGASLRCGAFLLARARCFIFVVGELNDLCGLSLQRLALLGRNYGLVIAREIDSGRTSVPWRGRKSREWRQASLRGGRCRDGSGNRCRDRCRGSDREKRVETQLVVVRGVDPLHTGNGLQRPGWTMWPTVALMTANHEVVPSLLSHLQRGTGSFFADGIVFASRHEELVVGFAPLEILLSDPERQRMA
ncbi:hypothetical protein C8F01DRAFT_1331129, partial [Mycena amicta]